MKLHLSVPSKTFLLGEYYILKGGPAFLLSTKPRFTLAADSKGRGRVEGIHPSSPAGRFMTQHPEVFSRWDITFNDPHEGLGGFGASSAQFVFVHCLEQLAAHSLDPRSLKAAFETLSLQDLWKSYRSYSDVGSGFPPSGADVIGQTVGGLARVTTDSVSVEQVSEVWPFENYGFFLVRTGRKVVTHTHLKKLEEVDVTNLSVAFSMGEKALKNGDGELLANAVTLYHEALLEQDLVAFESNELIEALASTEAVAAVKGCGALGADVLFVLYEKRNENIVRDRLGLLELAIVGTEKDLTEGLRLIVEKTRFAMKGVTI